MRPHLSLYLFLCQRNQGNLSVEDNVMYFGLLNIMDEVILPSLAFLTCNCCVSEELWSLLKLFPYELRYVHTQHPLVCWTQLSIKVVA